MSLLLYEHKKATFYEGADALEECLSTCPACAAKAQLQEVIGEIDKLDRETEDESSFAQEVLWWLETARKEIT